MPAAVLWDMDGTIVDTEPYWMAAETALVESYGGTWTHEDALSLVGQGLWHSARILQAHGVELGEDEIILALTRRVEELVSERVPWRPGALELLTELKASGIPMGLVTMSLRSLAELVASCIEFEAFDAIVAGNDVEHAKPHPEPYLKGAALLGVPATSCVAFEDSPPGLASAVASGAVAIGVPHMVQLTDDTSHILWPSLEGRTVNDIARAFSERSTS